MNDHELDQLLRGADPHQTAGDLREAKHALLEEIMTTPPTTPTTERPAAPAARPPRRRTLRMAGLAGALASAAVLVGAVAVPAWLDDDPSGGQAGQPHGSTPAVDDGDLVYASAVVKAAQRHPRMLIDGWTISAVNGFTDDTGSVVFTDGTRELEMTWYPAGLYDAYVRDRAYEGKAEPVEVAGGDGALYRYPSAGDEEVLLSPEGGVFAALRTGVDGWKGHAQVMAVLEKVRAASVDDWLAAMPRDVVTPAKAADVLATTLTGVPLPPGFDRGTLEDLGTNDRYQFGAQVTHRVACAWMDSYWAAKKAGDDATVDRATQALVGSRQWPVLQQIDAEGDMPEAIWDLADALAAGASPAELKEAWGGPC